MGKVITFETEAPGGAPSTGFQMVMPCDPAGAFDHDLKIDPAQFEAIQRGDKVHEVRVFDRDYQVGQVLKLRAYDRGCRDYTGQVLFARVKCITAPGTYGLPDNLGVMSIRVTGIVSPSASRELVSTAEQ